MPSTWEEPQELIENPTIQKSIDMHLKTTGKELERLHLLKSSRDYNRIFMLFLFFALVVTIIGGTKIFLNPGIADEPLKLFQTQTV